MKALLPLVTAVLLSACASYRIAPEEGTSLRLDDSTTVSIVKENAFPRGEHCYEPLLFVLTLGIVPTHCVDTYRATTEPKGEQPPQSGVYKHTRMSGWFALLMAAMPGWRYGVLEHPEQGIESMVRGKAR